MNKNRKFLVGTYIKADPAIGYECPHCGRYQYADINIINPHCLNSDKSWYHIPEEIVCENCHKKYSVYCDWSIV